MKNAIAQFSNVNDGITVFVVPGVNGFHVVLRDDDCGEYFSAVKCFPSEADALAHAEHVASGVPEAGSVISVEV